VTSDILASSSLKMNAQYNARTGRYYCCVGPKETEKEKNVTVPSNMLQAKQRVILDYFLRSAQRQSEVFLIILEWLCTLEEMQETNVCCVQKAIWTSSERERERESSISIQVGCLINHLYYLFRLQFRLNTTQFTNSLWRFTCICFESLWRFARRKADM